MKLIDGAGVLVTLGAMHLLVAGVKLYLGRGKMEKDVVLGAEDKAFLKIEGGKLILGNEYSGKQLGASVSVSADLDQFAVLLKAAIPGGIDDVIIDGLLAVLKSV